MSGMPRRCPACGSDKIRKEYHLSAQTGDWICGDCKETGWIEREESVTDYNTNKTHRVSIQKGGKEIATVMLEVASSPDHAGTYGFFTRSDNGMFESECPLPIKMVNGKYIVELPC